MRAAVLSFALVATISCGAIAQTAAPAVSATSSIAESTITLTPEEIKEIKEKIKKLDRQIEDEYNVFYSMSTLSASSRGISSNMSASQYNDSRDQRPVRRSNPASKPVTRNQEILMNERALLQKQLLATMRSPRTGGQ